jgi:hypothetical protein
LITVAILAAVILVVVGRQRSRSARSRALIDEVLAHPERRSELKAVLKREISDRIIAIGGVGIVAGRLGHDPMLRELRMALAEILVTEYRADEALQQVSFIVLPIADPGFDPPLVVPEWAWRLRLVACDAELQRRNCQAAAKWLAEPDLIHYRGGDAARAVDELAQMALLRGSPDEALRILERAPTDVGAAERITLTRARALAASGDDARAAELLRSLVRESLQRLQQRYDTEPVAALAAQLLSGPYR